MTQREALSNVLSSFDTSCSRALKVVFLSKWLEDINWHSERVMLWESIPDHLHSIAAWLELNEKSLRDSLVPHTHIPGLGHIETNTLRYELSKTNYYQAFNLIFGWGTQNDSFPISSGQGFVDDLLNLANLPKKQPTPSACPDCSGVNGEHTRASCSA